MARLSLRWLPFLSILLLIGAVFLAIPGQAKVPEAPDMAPEPYPFSDRYPAEVYLDSPGDLDILVELGADIDTVRSADSSRPFPGRGAPFEPLIAVVSVNAEEAERLADRGLLTRPIPNESLRALRLYGPGTTGPEAWPTFAQFVTRMQDIADAHPDIVRMMSIGQSVQGRDLWVLKITDNPDVEEDEPEFKFTSTMHGDEPVGTEMTIRLAELLVNNYGTELALTELVDEMEIWLCPIHNPDGYVAGSRYNAHGEDLNRDFPDRITDPYDNPAGREPETQVMMYFGYDHRFVMGANYHGGAAVVNYPWDSVPTVPDYAPDDTLYYEYSVGYAIRNSRIWNGGFPQGVTRGWEWYIIRGGMQDWAYHWQGEHHVTIELGNTKKPPYEQMDTYWGENQEAMLWWMERALRGARGLVFDAVTGEPLDATVDVVEIGKIVRTDPDVGDYHRLLLPGAWTLVCQADGYLDQTWTVEVISGTATVQDCALMPEAEFGVVVGGSEVSGQPGETVTHTFVITNIGTAADSYDVSLTPGDWPAALLDPLVGPLLPLESGQVQVRVQIPNEPAGKGLLATDVLTIEVTSQGTPGTGAQAQGVTHALADLAVELAADQASRSALAGEAVTYTLVVTNTGSYTDTYTLAAAGNLWPTQVTPGQTAPLAPGAAAQVVVRVEIPAGPPGQADTATIRATSGLDSQVYAEQSLITLRLWGVYLPVAVKTGE